MWVEAILAREDLEKVMNDLCPLRIVFGEKGSILISEPQGLELVPSAGLRMRVTVEVHWPVLGIDVPISVRSATLDVTPGILACPDGDKLTFKLRLDGIDISILPAFVDRGIVDLVNKELETKHVELSWGFTKTLSHVFDLPDALASVRAIDLCASWGKVRVTEEALVLAVSFEARIEPRGVEPGPVKTLVRSHLGVDAAAERPKALDRQSLRGLWRESPASLALLSGAAVAAGMSFAAFLYPRRRPRRLRDVLGELAWS